MIYDQFHTYEFLLNRRLKCVLFINKYFMSKNSLDGQSNIRQAYIIHVYWINEKSYWIGDVKRDFLHLCVNVGLIEWMKDDILRFKPRLEEFL